MSKTKSLEEKECYITLAAKQRCSERDFARLIDSGIIERRVISDKKLSATLTEFPANAKGAFKVNYIFEFLRLSDDHKENDLDTI